MSKVSRLLVISLLSVVVSSLSMLTLAKPKNVECLAPAGTGGGWDFTCRVPAGLMMTELQLVSGNINVVNMAGAGGGKAFAHVVAKREDDENLIVAASMATAVRLGQNVYAGFTEDNVRWVGALGVDYGVIAVRKDSPYRDLKQLLDAVKINPSKIPFVGGGSTGGWDHLKALILADTYGISELHKMNYIAFDSGGKAILEIISGRAVAFTGDTSEVLDYLDADKIRVLAVLSPQRVERLGNAKTATEQGLEVIGANWRGFYVPGGISDKAYNTWVDIVQTVAESDRWQELREKNGLAPFQSFGDDFAGFVKQQISVVNRLSKKLGFMK